MKTINLRDFYSSIYSADFLFNVPDEVAELLFLYKRLEEAQRRLIFMHKAYYSLDRNDGIENEAIRAENDATGIVRCYSGFARQAV
jgi:RNA polymerase sigma-70 factor (ECF subfamily)